MDHDQSFCSFLQRALKRGQGRRHGRADSLGGFRFYQPHLGVRTWNKKVYFQTLLIARIVEFLAHPTVSLTLNYFRCHEAFKQVSKEWRALKLSDRSQTEQVAGEAGVTQVDFRRLNESLPRFSKYGGRRMIWPFTSRMCSQSPIVGTVMLSGAARSVLFRIWP